MSITAGRENLLERATELRDRGLYYRQIAAELGTSVNRTWRLLNPERQRLIEQRANERKRRWDRHNYWRPCPRCGGGMSKRAKQCRDCYSKHNGV